MDEKYIGSVMKSSKGCLSKKKVFFTSKCLHTSAYYKFVKSVFPT